MGWAFLAVSLVGAWFTLNAFQPSRRWQLLGISFLAGWLTSELALLHVGWQAAATAVFVWLGALQSWPGIAGLVITLGSWAGLVITQLTAGRSREVMDRALRDGLGDDYRSKIAPGFAEHLVDRVSLRDVLLPFDLRDRRVERVKNIEYAPGAGRRHRLDVWRPRAGAHSAPVLLQIHGGAWALGAKDHQGLPLMLQLSAHGWVCIAINYQLSPRVTWPEHLIDCKRALRWIRDQVAEYGGDPDFVVVTGGSAGGHLASMVALTADDDTLQPGFEDVDTSVTACVPFYGVYDMADTFAPRGSGDAVGDWMSRRIMGATLREDRERYEQASPIHRITTTAPPFLVVHGARDNLVPVEQARRFVEALRAASRQPVLYAEIPGASHAFDIFHSVRTRNAVNGVTRFLAWLYSAYQAERPSPPAQPLDADATNDPS